MLHVDDVEEICMEHPELNAQIIAVAKDRCIRVNQQSVVHVISHTPVLPPPNYLYLHGFLFWFYNPRYEKMVPSNDRVANLFTDLTAEVSAYKDACECVKTERDLE